VGLSGIDAKIGVGNVNLKADGLGRLGNGFNDKKRK